MAEVDEIKRRLYVSGHYVFRVPPVTPHLWSDADWVQFIGDNWRACADPQCECHGLIQELRHG